jgi:hypothetical protein
LTAGVTKLKGSYALKFDGEEFASISLRTGEVGKACRIQKSD